MCVCGMHLPVCHRQSRVRNRARTTSFLREGTKCARSVPLRVTRLSPGLFKTQASPFVVVIRYVRCYSLKEASRCETCRETRTRKTHLASLSERQPSHRVASYGMVWYRIVRPLLCTHTRTRTHTQLTHTQRALANTIIPMLVRTPASNTAPTARRLSLLLLITYPPRPLVRALQLAMIPSPALGHDSEPYTWPLARALLSPRLTVAGVGAGAGDGRLDVLSQPHRRAQPLLVHVLRGIAQGETTKGGEVCGCG